MISLGTTSPICCVEILFAIDSPILEEGFRLYNDTLRDLRAEQKEDKQKIGTGGVFLK